MSGRQCKQGTEFERREHLLNELTQEERHLLPLVRPCLDDPDNRPPLAAIQKQLSVLPLSPTAQDTGSCMAKWKD